MCRQSQKVNSAPQKFAALGSKPHSRTCQGMVRASCSPKGAEIQLWLSCRKAQLQAGVKTPNRAPPSPSGPWAEGGEAPGEAHQDNQRLPGA